jgi:hypothetical protein
MSRKRIAAAVRQIAMRNLDAVSSSKLIIPAVTYRVKKVTAMFCSSS